MLPHYFISPAWQSDTVILHPAPGCSPHEMWSSWTADREQQEEIVAGMDTVSE